MVIPARSRQGLKISRIRRTRHRANQIYLLIQTRFHMCPYQAGSWDRKRRVVAKVEWHPGEPRVGFIVTNLSRPAERVVTFYNQRGKAFP